MCVGFTTCEAYNFSFLIDATILYIYIFYIYVVRVMNSFLNQRIRDIYNDIMITYTIVSVVTKKKKGNLVNLLCLLQ